MKCPKCGLETPDDGNFCSHCGAQVGPRDPEVAAAATIAASAAVAPGVAGVAGIPGVPIPTGEVVLWEGRPSIKPAIPGIIMVVAVAAILAAVLYYLMRFLADKNRELPPFVWTMLIPGAVGALVLFVLVRLVFQWVQRMTVRYSVSSQRIMMDRGVISKRHDELELEHYKDVIVHRSILDSLVGCGDIRVLTSDPTHPVMELRDVSNPIEKKEIIRTAAETRKRALGIVRREEL